MLRLWFFSWPIGFQVSMFGSWHIYSQNQDEFTVSFILRQASSSYFLRKLFEFGASVNSPAHLDCSLAVFYDNFIFRKQISLLINESSCWNLRLCSFSWPFGFQIVIFIYIFTLSFILRWMFIFLFFEEAVQIWSLYKFSWPFWLQSWYAGSIL